LIDFETFGKNPVLAGPDPRLSRLEQREIIVGEPKGEKRECYQEDIVDRDADGGEAGAYKGDDVDRKLNLFSLIGHRVAMHVVLAHGRRALHVEFRYGRYIKLCASAACCN
jgi:hypothetical protein